MNKVNLGCGNQHLEGFINVDIVQPADIICRLGREKLPFEDGSIDEIQADNLMEHLDNDEFLFAMNDIHRVLCKGGLFWFKVPDAEHWPSGAWGDPTHKRYFFERSFIYFTDTPTYHNYGKSYGFKMWNKKRLETDNKFWICELLK